jgi:hypothetical protein
VRQLTAGEGANETHEEKLFPQRHAVTLPLNGLNCMFEDYNVSFNHHTKLESDRYVCKPLLNKQELWFLKKLFLIRNYFLDFDGWGLVSALEQNFNPVPSDIERKENRGNHGFFFLDPLKN